MVIIGDDCIVAVFTHDLDVSKPLRNDEFLLIDTTFHINHFVIVHKCSTYLKRFIDSAELARAVACHHDGIGIVIVLGTKSRCHRKDE